jgi:hypothetical protein
MSGKNGLGIIKMVETRFSNKNLGNQKIAGTIKHTVQ